jgi:hypothetical protein
MLHQFFDCLQSHTYFRSGSRELFGSRFIEVLA